MTVNEGTIMGFAAAVANPAGIIIPNPAGVTPIPNPGIMGDIPVICRGIASPGAPPPPAVAGTVPDAVPAAAEAAASGVVLAPKEAVDVAALEAAASVPGIAIPMPVIPVTPGIPIPIPIPMGIPIAPPHIIGIDMGICICIGITMGIIPGAAPPMLPIKLG